MASEPSAATPAAPDVGLLFNLSPIALLILSPAWHITRASPRFLEGWRVSPEDCIGHQLLPFVEKHLRLPRLANLSGLTTAIDDAIASRAERTCRPINTIYAVSWTARVIPIFNGDELISIVLEWHEGPLVHAQDEFSKPGLSTDQAFRMFVQAVKDYAIFLLDTKGHVVTWNKGAELLKGYSRDDIIGRHFSLFYGQEDLDVNKPQMELEICLREGRVEDEGWRYRKDGSRFWANVVITAVYHNGVHVGFGKVTRDLTERKSAESRLIAAYEESEKLKSDFLANMSHEIRTPMHGMLSACTLLLDTPLSPSQRDIVSIMDESGQVLLQVINDILDYSKLTSGSFSMQSEIVGITSIVTSVVRNAQTTLPPSVHFELFLAPELPRSVQGDPLRYRQILQNIVSNAVKFTDKGSIRVRAAVHDEDEESFTILTEVTDTGIGVPEVATSNLFTPFTQFDATTTKQYQGTGLGLSIAKSLTELMGGRIGYRPNPERHGSLFWFTAQFKKIKRMEQMKEWPRSTKALSRSGTPLDDADIEPIIEELRMVSSTKNLLVVEDNLINQKVMLGMLRTIGFKNIGLASNGMEAVRMVRGKPAAYDIVLMDVNMPIMDGHQATKEIRASGILVPIVAMTAYALKGDRELCIEHGMNDYIAKPVNKKRLIMVLAKWLLRMTDYRKNFDLRLAELQRHEEASRERPEGKLEQGPATGSSDAPVPAAVDLAKPSPSQPVTQESTRAAEAASSASQATSGLGHEAQQHVPAVAAKSAEPAAEAPAAAPPVATISHPQFERPVTAANIASLTAQTEAEKPPEVASSASLPHRAAAAASQESAFASAQAPTPAGGEGSDVPLAPSSSEGSDDASRGPTHAAEPGQVREVSEVPPQSEEPSSCRVPSDRKHDSTEEVNEVSHDITPAEADPSSETSGGGAGGAPIGVAGPETAVGGCR